MAIANQFGINLGEIMSNVSNLKSAKQTREQNKTKFDWLKLDRVMKKANETAVSEKVSDMGYDKDFTLEDIKNFSGIEGDEKRKAMEGLNFLGNLTSKIQTSDKPVETYSTIRAYLVDNMPDIADKMPENYDPKFVNKMSKFFIQADDAVKGTQRFKELVQTNKTDITKEKIKVSGDIQKETIVQKGKMALENLKSKNKIAFEKIKNMNPEKKTSFTKYVDKVLDPTIPKKEKEFYLKKIKKETNISMSSNELMALLLSGDNIKTEQPKEATADTYLKGL